MALDRDPYPRAFLNDRPAFQTYGGVVDDFARQMQEQANRTGMPRWAGGRAIVPTGGFVAPGYEAAFRALGGQGARTSIGDIRPIRISKDPALSASLANVIGDLGTDQALGRQEFDRWMGQQNRTNQQIQADIERVSQPVNRLLSGDLGRELATGRESYRGALSGLIGQQFNTVSGLRDADLAKRSALIEGLEGDLGGTNQRGLDEMLGRITGLESMLGSKNQDILRNALAQNAYNVNDLFSLQKKAGLVPGTAYSARGALGEAGRLGADLRLRLGDIEREDVNRLAALRLGVSEKGLDLRRGDLANIYNQRAPLLAGYSAGQISDATSRALAEMDLEGTLFNAGRGDTMGVLNAQLGAANILPALRTSALNTGWQGLSARQALGAGQLANLGAAGNVLNNIDWLGLDDGRADSPYLPSRRSYPQLPLWAENFEQPMSAALQPRPGFDYSQPWLNPNAWGDYRNRTPAQQRAFDTAGNYYEESGPANYNWQTWNSDFIGPRPEYYPNGAPARVISDE